MNDIFKFRIKNILTVLFSFVFSAFAIAQVVFKPDNKDFNNNVLLKNLKALSNNYYSNPGEFDDWAYKKLSKLDIDSIQFSNESLNDVLHNLYNRKYYKSANRLANSLVNSTKGNDDIPGITYLILANQQIDLNQTDSIHFYLNVLKKSKDFKNDVVLQIGFHTGQAVIAENKGDYFKAIVEYHEAENLLQDDMIKNKSIIYQNLAGCYLKMKYFEKAEYYLEKSFSTSKHSKESYSNLSTLAIIKMRLGKYQESEKWHHEALTIAKKFNSPIYIAQTFSNLGNVARREKKIDLALDYFKKSDSICTHIDLSFGLLINKINRSEVYTDLKSYQKAINLLKIAEKESANFQNSSNDMEIYRLLYVNYDYLNNPVLSNKYFRKYIELRDTSTGDEKKSLITEWELLNEREKAKIEKALLNEKLLIEENKKHLLYIILTSLIIIALLAYFSFKRNTQLKIERTKRDKQELKFKIETLSKELIAESVKSQSVNQLREDIYQDLKKLKGDEPASKELRLLIKKIEKQLHSKDSYWNQFESRFVGVYDDFFYNLRTKAPHLTPAEIKMASLIKLQLSTKEMAEIMNLSIGTIKNYRSTLRKKLNLDTDKNLTLFLSEL